MIEVIAEGNLSTWCQQRQAFFIKTQNITHHAVKRWRKQIAPLCEQTIERGAIVFEAGSFVAHTKAHLAIAPGHACFAQYAFKLRIGFIVKYNKAGIYGMGFTVYRHLVGMRMAADIVIGFKQRDLVLPVQ